MGDALRDSRLSLRVCGVEFSSRSLSGMDVAMVDVASAACVGISRAASSDLLQT